MAAFTRKIAFCMVVCWTVVAIEPTTVDTASDKNLCAMTEVLVAMKGLLVMLSGEIRDLKKQVHDSCQAGGGGGVVVVAPPQDHTPANATVPEDLNHKDEDIDLQEDDEIETPSITNTTSTTNTSTMATTEPILDLDYEDYDSPEGDYNNPVNDLVSGLSSWWQSVSIFAPKPTGSPNTTTEQPDAGDQDLGAPDEDQQLTRTSPAPPTTTTTTATTTTTTETPLSLPPVPNTCPEPFRLEAESCFLILHDQRDWKSWGDAHAVCQNYGGELAAPWRLAPLQEYLSRYYSDAFWVGGRQNPNKRSSWQWLSGREVQKNEWKPGQPQKNPGKKCMFLDKWSGYHAKNFFCGEKYPFICEYRAV